MTRTMETHVLTKRFLFMVDNHPSYDKIEENNRKGAFCMEILGIDIAQWIVAGLELALLIWFMKAVKTIKQNQQILIDELEALLAELKNKK